MDEISVLVRVEGELASCVCSPPVMEDTNRKVRVRSREEGPPDPDHTGVLIYDSPAFSTMGSKFLFSRGAPA